MWAAHLCLGLLHHLIVRIHQQLLTALQLCVGVLCLPETSIFVAHVPSGRDPRRKVQVQALRNTRPNTSKPVLPCTPDRLLTKLANADKQAKKWQETRAIFGIKIYFATLHR